ncbi:MAG: PIN domain-containing protein [Thermodesulfobacteriota bacterium]
MAPRERFLGREINYTRGKFFIDTNILVYAYDSSAGKKWKASSEIVSILWTHRTGILSTQVLQELFVSLTQKVKNTIFPETAREIISSLLHWPLVVNDGKNILRAIDLQLKYQFSFWDSLILQAAIISKAEFLLSEDFRHEQVIESVIVLNPFSE